MQPKKENDQLQLQQDKKTPSLPNENTAASTKIHSNEIERLDHTDFWADRPKTACYETVIATKLCDCTTILSSKSIGEPSTENLGGENIPNNNQRNNIPWCDR